VFDGNALLADGESAFQAATAKTRDLAAGF
jgi:hypothetical protein